ncbi:MAG TPA: hypothetical protein VMW29_01555 [Candidatus Bathyarchaeia archaeon]|nr:hypothetical protein [Candidatus Bathyarchaeia archaeon]
MTRKRQVQDDKLGVNDTADPKVEKRWNCSIIAPDKLKGRGKMPSPEVNLTNLTDRELEVLGASSKVVSYHLQQEANALLTSRRSGVPRLEQIAQDGNWTQEVTVEEYTNYQAALAQVPPSEPSLLDEALL